jgi:Uma2 family endonuclease
MSTATTKPTRAAKTAKVPPLKAGQRLSRAEFYRRWEAMPDLKHAERIEGVVYMQAAIRAVDHGHPHGQLIMWLYHYEAHTPGVQAYGNTTVELDEDNEPEPDGVLRVTPESGGQSRVTDEEYVSGAPEFLGEISASTPRDLTVKKNVYRRNGVQEYLVWKTGKKKKQEIFWFRLRDGDFEPLKPDAGGVFKSEVFPGLWLDAKAMMAGVLPKVLDVLQQGLASLEHAKFVQQLQAKAKQSKQ